MAGAYPPLLPVITTPHTSARASLPPITLPGGARLIDYRVDDPGRALQVALTWQGGPEAAPEDYRMELVLLDSQQQIRSSWLAYQTQAHYPTRAWEPDDVVYDVGWLPLDGLEAGEYEVKLRVMGQAAAEADWLTLAPVVLDQDSSQEQAGSGWTVWQNGEIATGAPTFRERETVQFTAFNNLSAGADLRIVGPDGTPRSPAGSGSGWANFMVEPDWPAGDYFVVGPPDTGPVLRVAKTHRNFDIPPTMQPVEADFEGQVKLLGYHLPSRRVEAGEGLPVTLYWQGLQWMGESFVIFNRLLDNQQVSWGGYDRLPLEDYDTLLWAPHEIVFDGFAVPVDEDARDGVYMLRVGLYRQIDNQARSLRIRHPETGALTDQSSISIGPVKVGGPPAGVTVDQADPQHPVGVDLAKQITLLGYDLDLIENTRLDLTFYWQALTEPETDYTIFAHVRDAAGETIAQNDNLPTNGLYPTSLWDPQETIKDDFSVPIEQLSTGRYQLVVGLYDRATGERLPVKGSANGEILLETFEVE
jgi:hypothetical protein